VVAPYGWHCHPNVPKKQCNDQVAADVSTHLTKYLYCGPPATAADMTAERGAWRGLRYDITGIKQCRDDFSEHEDSDVVSVGG